MDPATPLPPIQLPGGISEMTESVLRIAGQDLGREAATYAAFFLLFFIGVAFGIVLRLNGGARWYQAIVGSVPVGLIASPSVSQAMSGGRLAVNSNLIDRLADWLNGNSDLSAGFFWFGAVLLFGMLSWQVLQMVLRLAKAALAVFERIAGREVNPGGGA